MKNVATFSVPITVFVSGPTADDPKIVTAVAGHDTDILGVGAAHCDADDKFNYDVGLDLAVGRALCDLAKKLKRAGWDHVHLAGRKRSLRESLAAMVEQPAVTVIVDEEAPAPKKRGRKRS